MRSFWKRNKTLPEREGSSGPRLRVVAVLLLWIASYPKPWVLRLPFFILAIIAVALVTLSTTFCLPRPSFPRSSISGLPVTSKCSSQRLMQYTMLLLVYISILSCYHGYSMAAPCISVIATPRLWKVSLRGGEVFVELLHAHDISLCRSRRSATTWRYFSGCCSSCPLS